MSNVDIHIEWLNEDINKYLARLNKNITLSAVNSSLVNIHRRHTQAQVG
jgi:hypothetical protein